MQSFKSWANCAQSGAALVAISHNAVYYNKVKESFNSLNPAIAFRQDKRKFQTKTYL